MREEDLGTRASVCKPSFFQPLSETHTTIVYSFVASPHIWHPPPPPLNDIAHGRFVVLILDGPQRTRQQRDCRALKFILCSQHPAPRSRRPVTHHGPCVCGRQSAPSNPTRRRQLWRRRSEHGAGEDDAVQDVGDTYGPPALGAYAWAPRVDQSTRTSFEPGTWRPWRTQSWTW